MSSTLEEAIQRATSEGRGGLGTVVVWAACNGPFDIALDEVASDPRVIAVGRSSRRDLDEGSAEGQALDLLAPGTEVVTTGSNGQPYVVATGTSLAAPLVAAACGLVVARYPHLTRQDVYARITSTCDPIGGVQYTNGHHPRFGYGRLNAGKALI
jgi:thermitase